MMVLIHHTCIPIITSDKSTQIMICSLLSMYYTDPESISYGKFKSNGVLLLSTSIFCGINKTIIAFPHALSLT